MQEFSSVQSLSSVQLSATPWTAACQASLFITNSRSPPKPMSIESVMPSNHLILCRPLLLLPSSFPASGSFPVSQLFTSGGQSIGVSASALVLPVNTQDWSPLGWTGWISLQSKGLSRVFSNTAVQKHQFFRAHSFLCSSSCIHIWLLEKAYVCVSCSVMYDSLQHARLPCPSSTPGAYSNSCALSRWCHPTISPSIGPFSFILGYEDLKWMSLTSNRQGFLVYSREWLHGMWNLKENQTKPRVLKKQNNWDINQKYQRFWGNTMQSCCAWGFSWKYPKRSLYQDFHLNSHYVWLEII